jgi:diguanylate cyclase (GGDEF)-like protein
MVDRAEHDGRALSPTPLERLVLARQQVNDRFGHDEGSALLVEAVDAIREVVRTSDIVCRYGGDEFCAMLTGGDESMKAVSRRLLEVIARRNASTTRLHELSLSLGTAIYQPGDGVTVEDLMRRADETMYEQKVAKKAQVVSEDDRNSRLSAS